MARGASAVLAVIWSPVGPEATPAELESPGVWAATSGQHGRSVNALANNLCRGLRSDCIAQLSSGIFVYSSDGPFRVLNDTNRPLRGACHRFATSSLFCRIAS